MWTIIGDEGAAKGEVEDSRALKSGAKVLAVVSEGLLGASHPPVMTSHGATRSPMHHRSDGLRSTCCRKAIKSPRWAFSKGKKENRLYIMQVFPIWKIALFEKIARAM